MNEQKRSFSPNVSDFYQKLEHLKISKHFFRPKPAVWRMRPQIFSRSSIFSSMFVPLQKSYSWTFPDWSAGKRFLTWSFQLLLQTDEELSPHIRPTLILCPGGGLDVWVTVGLIVSEWGHKDHALMFCFKCSAETSGLNICLRIKLLTKTSK